METYSDLLQEYKEQRELLFKYMKTIDNVEQIRIISSEIVNIDKKIIEINKMPPYMISSFVLYKTETFESKLNDPD